MQTSPAEIVREYFPAADDAAVDYLLWGRTGWPAFWDGDPETVMRRQLRRFKRASEVVRGQMCEMCSRAALSRQFVCRPCKKIFAKINRNP